MTSAAGPIHVKSGRSHRPGEVGAFGQEAIAGMHRVALALGGGAEQTLDVEVRVGRHRARQGDGVVGELGRQRAGVGFAVHDDGFEAEVVARADHADGDLPPVGDEYAG